ncbi:MAG: hypothetical protein V4550_17890 [Gemmatimonadota bacterium]
MKTLTRIIPLAAVILGVASAASAQSLATFGSVEVGGFGEGSALLGTSWSTGRLGVGPVANLVAMTYRYRNGLNSHAQAYALSPSIGLQNSMPEGSISAMVGYTFVNTEFNGLVSGAELGARNGVFVSAQGNYWGNGENSAQVIGSYGFESEYYWTRFRASHRLSPTAHPVYLGGELVLQGSQKTETIAGFTTPTQFRYEIGPTIEYRVSQDFRVGASGGLRAGNNNTPSSGYARVEFLLLTNLSGK